MDGRNAQELFCWLPHQGRDGNRHVNKGTDATYALSSVILTLRPQMTEQPRRLTTPCLLFAPSFLGDLCNGGEGVWNVDVCGNIHLLAALRHGETIYIQMGRTQSGPRAPCVWK